MRAWGLMCVVACVTQFRDRDGAGIRCETADDCYDGWACEGFVCVDPSLPKDTTAPTFVSATPSDPRHVQLVFSEAIIDSEAKFTVTPDLAVLSAERQDALVTLLVTPQVVNARYTLTIENAHDVAGNALPTTTVDFVAYGSTVDPNPPALVLPAEGARIFGGTASLRWSRRSLANSYTIQVSAHADFSDAREFTVLDPTDTIDVPVTDAVTTYWRVRADVTRAEEWTASRFETMGDRMYVYCPAAATCDDTGQIGNKSHPFRTILRGQNEAFIAGMHRVDIAGRGGGAEYLERVDVVAGISMFGGYGPAFDEADRGHETATYYSGQYALSAISILEPTEINRLTVRNDPAPDFAAFIFSSSDALTLRDCRFIGGSNTLWVQISGATPDVAPLIEGCEISGTNAGGDTVQIQDSSARLVRNTVIGSPSGNGSALRLTRSLAPLIEGNSVDCPLVTTKGIISETAHATLVSNRFGCNVFIDDTANQVAWIIANNVFKSFGTRMPAARLHLSNNYFKDTAYLGGPAIVSNNLFAPVAALPCVSTDPTTNIVSIQNNAFLNCVALIARQGVPPTNCDGGVSHCAFAGSENDETEMNGGIAGTVEGNVAASGPTLFLAADGKPSAQTPSSITAGGKDTRTATCGADLLQPCGGVTGDIVGQARTCNGVGDCFCMGPYEQD